MTDERVVEAPYSPGALAGGRTRTSGTPTGANATSRKHHGHTVTTIRTICRTYMRYPNDRPYMPLTVPGVEGKTYLQVFKSIRGKPESLMCGTRLFYAPIRWKTEPTVAEAYCELTLSAGEWDQTAQDFKSLYRVRVNWASWSKSRRTCLIREYDVTREEAREQAKADKAVKGLLFFVGTQDENDLTLFHVEHHRLICSLSGIVEQFTKK